MEKNRKRGTETEKRRK